MTYSAFSQSFAAAQQAAYEDAIRRKQEAWYDERVRRKENPFQSSQSPRLANDHWAKVLNLPVTATAVQIKAAYRKLAKTAHVDAGGSDEKMSRLNTARDQALQERK